MKLHSYTVYSRMFRNKKDSKNVYYQKKLHLFILFHRCTATLSSPITYNKLELTLLFTVDDISYCYFVYGSYSGVYGAVHSNSEVLHHLLATIFE